MDILKLFYNLGNSEIIMSFHDNNNELILQKTNVMQSSASKGLRYLRDVENIACEQGRFSDLFKRAQKQVSE